MLNKRWLLAYVMLGLCLTNLLVAVKKDGSDRVRKVSKSSQTEQQLKKGASVMNFQTLTEQDIQGILKDRVHHLITVLGQSFHLGKPLEVIYKASNIFKKRIQISYIANFPKKKGVQLLVLGKILENHFKITRISFAQD